MSDSMDGPSYRCCGWSLHVGHAPSCLFSVPESRKSASHGEAGYERRERDAYFTEPWVTKALLAAFPDGHFGSPVWEPACGDGRMAEVLLDAGYCVCYSDVHDYGYRPDHFLKHDFLRDAPPDSQFCAIITNPPFDLAIEFVVRALEITMTKVGKVAILQRHEFDAPAKNHPLFAFTGGTKLVLYRRPRWTDGADKASPRFPYAWYVWDWAKTDWSIKWCHKT